MTETDKRIVVMMQELLDHINQNICQGLLVKHQLLFTMRLAQIKQSQDKTSDSLYNLFLK